MARVVKPLAEDSGGGFSRGPFVATCTEFLATLSGREKLSGKVLENRTYLGLGLRRSQRMDMEAGYLRQHTQGSRADTLNHALLLTRSHRL